MFDCRRVCNSDVASDSSSEYASEEEKNDNLSAEAPICLKAKVSHSLAYVPSMFDRLDWYPPNLYHHIHTLNIYIQHIHT